MTCGMSCILSGFLPTFGPCFINCYGLPREYSDLPDKYDHLNKGLVSGMDSFVVTIALLLLANIYSLKIVFCSSSLYTQLLYTCSYHNRGCEGKLFGAFFSANMVYLGNHPVQFEVSIGNYGNKQDDKSPIQTSTTPPSNPLYDGTKYYYLPWLKEKPVIDMSNIILSPLHMIEC